MSKEVLKGRISNLRDHGKIAFVDLRVEQKVTPSYIAEGVTEEFRKVKKQFYLGAVVTLEGYYSQNSRSMLVFVVQRATVESKKGFFPKEYPKSEVKDLQLRYKSRTWDLIVNKEKFHLLKLRYQVLDLLRSLLKSKGFTEVDVPVLQNYYGGAMAQPFKTVSNYNHKQYYLRISLEFALKKLIIAGFKNVFCIGSVFRNEDLDQTHSFEFSMLQLYTTYYSYEEVIALFEELYRQLHLNLYGSYLTQEGFDLRSPWPRFKQKEVLRLCKQHNMTVDQLLRSNKLGPYCHLQNYQKCPLGIDPYRFETYVRGTEIVTAYQEQNDSETLKKECKEVGYPLVDQSFVHDLGYGMHKTVGLGFGIQRLLQALFNEKSIREVQPFPFY